MSVDWNARLHAVATINDLSQREDAFRNVALTASREGEDAFVQSAISNIDDPELRDDTARLCAVALANKGKYAEAVEIAKIEKKELGLP